MISCDQCGTAISSIARFCKNCGVAISNSGQLDTTFFSLDPKSISADKIKSTKNLESISQAIFVAPAHFLNKLSEIFSTAGVKPYSILSGEDEKDIKNKILHKLQQNKDHPPKYICLIGNWDEVPPFKLIAPEITHDDDEFCITDAPYGCIQAYDEENIFTVIPDIPVGRIPTIDSGVLIRLFFDEEIKTDANKAFLFAVSAQVWNRATEKIINTFLNSEDGNRIKNDPDVNKFPYRDILSSPNWYEDDLKKITRQKLDIKNSVLLFNVHGGLDEPTWVGEAEGKYTKIFDIDTINDFNSSIIISEACYGGALGYDPKSIVEVFFERGGRAFIGSSTISYGAANGNIFGADHIALYFLKAIARGDEFGDALIFSKSEVAKSDSLYKFVGEKTILSFNLFGLPWGRSLPTPSLTSTVDPATFDVTLKLEQIRSRTSSLGVNKGNTLDNIRNRYLSNLNSKNKQFLLNKAEAREKFRRFKDANKINNMLIEWSGNSDDYLLQFFSNNDEEGYALFSQAPGFDKSTKTMILLIDSMGNLNKTLTSKGAI